MAEKERRATQCMDNESDGMDNKNYLNNECKDEEERRKGEEASWLNDRKMMTMMRRMRGKWKLRKEKNKAGYTATSCGRVGGGGNAIVRN